MNINNNYKIKFMIDPISIIVKADELQVEGISQYFITVMSDYEKFDIVKKLFPTLVVSQCIIYVNSVNRRFYFKNLTIMLSILHLEIRNNFTNKLKFREAEKAFRSFYIKIVFAKAFED